MVEHHPTDLPARLWTAKVNSNTDDSAGVGPLPWAFRCRRGGRPPVLQRTANPLLSSVAVRRPRGGCTTTVHRGAQSRRRSVRAPPHAKCHIAGVARRSIVLKPRRCAPDNKAGGECRARVTPESDDAVGSAAGGNRDRIASTARKAPQRQCVMTVAVRVLGSVVDQQQTHLGGRT